MAVGGLLGLALLPGCGPSVQGFYVGHRDIKAPKHIAGTAGVVELKLKSGNRFELLQYSLPVEGTYEVRDNKIYLTAKTSLGHDLAGSGQGMYLVKDDGGGWELHDPLGPMPEPVLLTEKEEPIPKQ